MGEYAPQVVREELLSRWHLNRDPSEEIEASWGDTRKTFQVKAIKAENKKELGEPEFQRFGINACLCTWTTRQQGECFQGGKVPRPQKLWEGIYTQLPN